MPSRNYLILNECFTLQRGLDFVIWDGESEDASLSWFRRNA